MGFKPQNQNPDTIPWRLRPQNHGRAWPAATPRHVLTFPTWIHCRTLIWPSNLGFLGVNVENIASPSNHELAPRSPTQKRSRLKRNHRSHYPATTPSCARVF
ncbi:hypothetical protein D8674_024688 [Pyrus ussuriensis x Pyrus communis]|uniref:Uncharacterized protein n=1 Tax=Pyrus ussuriensis x Pyrus communis TaxID=2448454 RepID=A0A5N5H3M5_9ROSA|nr:hypothetical protein D8674_024688 [Pyrus ussuriensis x Pyrus communis]